MLLKNIVSDVITHGYNNMSIEYSVKDLEESIVIKEFLKDNAIGKAVITIDDDKIVLKYYRDDELLGESTLELKSFGWQLSKTTLYLYDDSITSICDSHFFDLY